MFIVSKRFEFQDIVYALLVSLPSILWLNTYLIYYQYTLKTYWEQI